MLFTKPRAYNSTTKTPLQFTSTKRPIIEFPIHVPTKVSVVHTKSYEDTVQENRNNKKIKWGEPFWNLFHVMAEKVKDTEYPRIRAGLLNLVYVICSNLPCPDCTTHAMGYLNGVNFNTIRTKDDFKTLLYNFHNAVNARKSFPIFPRENLDSKYSCGNLIPIFEDFMKHFLKRNSGAFKLLADDLQRQHVGKVIKKWFQDNIKSFNI